MDHERMPYFEVWPTVVRKEDLGEGCFAWDEFDGDDSQIDDNFYETPTCFESFLF